MPVRLFLPVDRRDFLRLVRQIDAVANCAEDVGVLRHASTRTKFRKSSSLCYASSSKRGDGDRGVGARPSSSRMMDRAHGVRASRGRPQKSRWPKRTRSVDSNTRPTSFRIAAPRRSSEQRNRCRRCRSSCGPRCSTRSAPSPTTPRTSATSLGLFVAAS